MVGADRLASRDHPLFDSSVVRAWYAQLADASKTPGLVQHLVRRTGELLPRFAAYFDRLRALPRRVRRALGRCRGLSLARVALLLALCSGPLHAATIFVDETTCRLADAITAAETDTATGGCPAGSGADLIVLDADVTLGAALPTINSEVTIEAGQAAVIDGGGSTACLSIVQGVVTLDGLTVRNCVAPNFVGGAVTNYGTTTILNCTLSGNSATGSPGGGAVRNEGTLTIVGSTISGNTAVRDGGGIYNNGSLTISQSILSGNTAAGSGGGLYNYSYNGSATFTDSVISGNAASKGGGISTGSFWYGDRRPLDIRTSTISGNTASVGGGIASYEYGTVLLTESTLSGNTATSKGGAVFTNPGFLNELTLTASTISGNSAGEEGGGIFARGTEDYGYSTLALAHVLISGNTAPLAPEMSFEPSIDVFADNFNLVGYDGDDRSEGFTPGATDIVPAQGVLLDDILAPLADNGGPTQTHALVSGSPAVDAVPTSEPNCLGTTDQRGLPRPAGSGCDIGSVEIGARFPFGGSVTGITPRKVSCRERSGGQKVQQKTSTPSWSCEALGLVVQPGDPVQTKLQGTVDATDAHVGGSVTGMTPTSVSCENNSTGQKVGASTSATSWDCEAMGLVVQPGDTVTTGATGTIDPPPVR